MHQVQVNTPKGKGEQVARLALEKGIQQASIQQVFMAGPDKEVEVVTIQANTPTTRTFIDALMQADFFNPQDYNIAAQQLPAMVIAQKPSDATRSFSMPATDVFGDLWQRNQIDPNYLSRAVVASLLLAYGMIQNQIITMVAALLFMPFLAQELAAAFGLVTRQRRLAAQGGLMLALTTVILVVSGMIVAAATGGPLQYDSFNPLLVNFLISLLVGAVAGISSADVKGRRQLIAVAAAAQFAVYPAWFGIMFVLGLPDTATVQQRLFSLLINVVTIFSAALVAYLLMRYRGEGLERYSQAVGEE